MLEFFTAGLNNAPAIIQAASTSRLALAALLLLLLAALIAYLLKSAPKWIALVAIVVLAVTGLAAIGQDAGGFLLPGLVKVYRGEQPSVNHFILGTRSTIRGAGGSNAGFIASDSAPGRPLVWQTTPDCRPATTDDFVLYFSSVKPCMTPFGYLFAPGEEPPRGASFIQVWRGDSPGNHHLLYVNPDISNNTGYTPVGFIQR